MRKLQPIPLTRNNLTTSSSIDGQDLASDFTHPLPRHSHSYILDTSSQQILASEMVGKEMVRIVRNDEHKYPLDDPVAKAKAASGRRRAGAWTPSDLDVIDEQVVILC